MGILTNPRNRSRIATVITEHANKLSFLSFLAGVMWFVALAHPLLNAGVYFSENALLPGLVESQFSSHKQAESWFEEYKKEIKAMKVDSEVPLQWLKQQLVSIGLEVYSQKYNFTYPMNLLNNQTASGENVYGILRAPRGASTEGIVLTAPLRPRGSGLTPTEGGVALILALAKHMRRYTYWAKDIIFLYTQHELIGMQAWLDGYYSTQTSSYIVAGELPARAGAIQAAVNLEFENIRFGGLNVNIEGINGILPNLDLVNLVTRLSQSAGLKTTLHDRAPLYTNDQMVLVQHNAVGMLLMMMQQATGMANGNHGLFLRYRVEAVSIQALPGSSHGAADSGKLVEGIFRSINNLLEQFHQSFFFYLLPCHARYISIGVYMPPFALMAAAGLIQAIALWNRFTKAVESRDDSIRSTKEKAFTPDGKLSEETLKTLRLPDSAFHGIVQALPLLIGCQIAGLMLYRTPELFGSGEIKQLPAVDAVVLGCVALVIAFMIVIRSILRKEEFDHLNWHIFKMIGLIQHGLILFSLSLLNISLAVIMALLTVPVYCLARPVVGRAGTLLQSILLMFCSPPAIYVVFKYLHSALTDGKLLHMSWARALENLQTGLIYGLIDHAVFSNWMFTAVTLVILPNWLMMWGVIWMNN